MLYCNWVDESWGGEGRKVQGELGTELKLLHYAVLKVCWYFIKSKNLVILLLNLVITLS